jgi:hypothetical protein
MLLGKSKKILALFVAAGLFAGKSSMNERSCVNFPSLPSKSIS